MKKGFPFYLIIISLFLGIISIDLLSDGMFMDGLLYAAISKNLANNLGSFWNLYLSETLYPSFHEHPPLAMGLQSIFFRMFGNSLLVERFYSLLTYIITGFVIVKIWQQISDKERCQIAWLPLLLWVSTPIVMWGCANNMLENTMMIFVALSVLFIIRSTEKHRFIYLFMAGIMLFLGFLSKGFVALFPWGLFFFIWLFSKKINFTRSIIDTLWLFIFTIFPIFLIYLFDYSGIESLIAYFDKQVLGSIENVETVTNRFFIIKRLFSELLPSIIILFIVFIIVKIKKIEIDNFQKNWGYIFFCLGLSGVFPIMISMKQSGFYILAAYPYFSIALGFFIAPYIYLIYNKISLKKVGFKITVVFSIILFISSIIFSFLQTKKIGRDKEMLADIYAISEVIPDNSIIGIPHTIYSNWSLHGYFVRLYNISLDSKDCFGHKYYLTNKEFSDKIPESFQNLNIATNKFVLFEKRLE